jgi:hypothetical protein
LLFLQAAEPSLFFLLLLLPLEDSPRRRTQGSRGLLVLRGLVLSGLGAGFLLLFLLLVLRIENKGCTFGD